MAFKDNHIFYKSAISKHGISAQGVHWNSEYNQYKRFEVLTCFVKDEIKESTIVDAGCGFGEYYNYLFDNLYVRKIFHILFFLFHLLLNFLNIHYKALM